MGLEFREVAKEITSALNLGEDEGKIEALAKATKTRSNLGTRKDSRQLRTTPSPMTGESRDLSHAARASDLFLGGLPPEDPSTV